MNKPLRHLSLFLMVLIISTVAISTLVYAKGLIPTFFISRPTANVVTGTVTDPAKAYDSNEGTYARMRYDATGNSLEVKTFSITGAPATVEIVAIKIRYAADAGGTGEYYYIDYYVGTSGPVTLQASTSAAYTLATREWVAPTEPIDGVWSWTDINSLRIIFHSTSGGGGAANIDVYEVWVEVFSYLISRPTANVVTGSVTDPAKAYDRDNTTYAQMRYDATGNSLEVKTFSTTEAPTTNLIGIVDIKIRYSADGSTSVEQYYIDYYVDTFGPVTLQASTSAAYALATREWLAVTEPYDGVWNWTDITKLRIIFHSTRADGTGGAQYIYPYEVWLHVFSYRKPTVSVTPPGGTQTAPFTVTIDIASVDDLYGWEFKLYYDTTILTATSVTEGTFLSQSGSTWFNVIGISDAYNSTHGRVWATCTLLGDILGTTGSGTLASVSFNIDAITQPSTSFLRLRDVKLSGYEKSYGKRVCLMRPTTVDSSVTCAPLLEFPYGLTMEISLALAVIYIFYRTRRKTKTPNISKAPPQIRYN